MSQPTPCPSSSSLRSCWQPRGLCCGPNFDVMEEAFSRLRNKLVEIKIPHENISLSELAAGEPTAFFPIFFHMLYHFSRPLCEFFSAKYPPIHPPQPLSPEGRQEYLDAVVKQFVLISLVEFDYQPNFTKTEFKFDLSPAMTIRKIAFVLHFIDECYKLHNSFVLKNQARRSASTSGCCLASTISHLGDRTKAWCSRVVMACPLLMPLPAPPWCRCRRHRPLRKWIPVRRPTARNPRPHLAPTPRPLRTPQRPSWRRRLLARRPTSVTIPTITTSSIHRTPATVLPPPPPHTAVCLH